MYGLAILMKYFLKKKIFVKSSEWFSDIMYLMNNNFLFQNTLSAVIIMIYGYNINYLKYTNNIPAQLIIILYETRYNQHNYFRYHRPSIIDQFTLTFNINIVKLSINNINLGQFTVKMEVYSKNRYL